MKNLTSIFLNILKKTTVAEDNLREAEKVNNGVRDYLKLNIIDEDILTEVVKTDLIRTELISNLVRLINIEIESLKEEERNKENISSINWLKEKLDKNEKRIEKLIKRNKVTHQEKNEDSGGLREQMTELRRFIAKDAIDLFLKEINKFESVNKFENDIILLIGRYNRLERENRHKTISDFFYKNEKTEIFLEFLNLTDEIYQRERDSRTE